MCFMFMEVPEHICLDIDPATYANTCAFFPVRMCRGGVTIPSTQVSDYTQPYTVQSVM